MSIRNLDRLKRPSQLVKSIRMDRLKRKELQSFLSRGSKDENTKDDEDDDSDDDDEESFSNDLFNHSRSYHSFFSMESLMSRHSNDEHHHYEHGPEQTLKPKQSIHHREGQQVFDFLKDDPRTMTYGRRIALYLMRYSWYYPRAKHYVLDENGYLDETRLRDNNTPMESNSSKTATTTPTSNRKNSTNNFKKPKLKASLAKAWAYFEHVTLPRHVVYDKSKQGGEKRWFQKILRRFQKGDQTFDRADPGELLKRTKLYSPIFTPISQMGDFGLGTGLYFTNLRVMMIITFVLGLINIPNILYFASHEYSAGQPGVPIYLKGTAICTKFAWVPCPECTMDAFGRNLDRLANITTVDKATGREHTLIFARRNLCNGASFELARINLLTIVFLVLGLIALRGYEKKWKIAFQEDEETAQDYSIVIQNPPKDASDPDEWKHFFEERFDAKVAVVTIGIDNDLLVRTLVQRREVLRRLELSLEPGSALDVLTLARISSLLENKRNILQWVFHFFVNSVPEYFGKLIVLTSRVQGLAQQEYKVRNVFITFQKESTRLRILNEFAVGGLEIWGLFNSKNQNNDKLKFRGKLLKIRQPDEPATIRWQDLNSKTRTRITQMLVTTILAFCVMSAFAIIITIAYQRSAFVGAQTISFANLAFPEIAKQFTNFESHFSEGDKQASLYFKIALFRWINTAIVITIITPFTVTLDNAADDGLIPAVYQIFFSELITINAIRLADPYGHFQRNVLAPRARTQDGMNLHMRGSEVELAERITDMTKIIFLAFWYTAIYPGALFFCSFILFVKFFVDRFGLMRTWKRVPPLGDKASVFSRRYFISTAIVALALISSYYWSGFPYDNLCLNEGSRVHQSYVGKWEIQTLGPKNKTEVASVGMNDPSYRFCLQDLFRTEGPSFPAIPENQPPGGEWMTPEQEKITSIFGWTGVACIAFVLLTLLWTWTDGFAELFYHKTETGKVASKRTFDEVRNETTISTYIPQVESPLFSYPLLACNTDDVGDGLFDWTDPDRSHSYYDLTKDAEFLIEGIGLDINHAFSKIKQYSPHHPGKQKSYRYKEAMGE